MNAGGSARVHQTASAAAGNAVFVHRQNHFIWHQVRLFLDQTRQKVRMLLQRRDASAPRLGRADVRHDPAVAYQQAANSRDAAAKATRDRRA